MCRLPRPHVIEWANILLVILLIVYIGINSRFYDSNKFHNIPYPIATTMVDTTFLKSHDHLLYTTKLKFFIGVFSSLNNLEKRNGVRNTWGNHTSLWNQGIALRFLIGRTKNKDIEKALRSEQAEYGDIVRPDIEEGYYAIASKAAALAQFASSQLQCDYVVKTDDDSYIRIDHMVNDILRRKVKAPFLWGRITYKSKPIRNKKSKWYISNYDYHDDYFPPYAFGPGYAFSIDIAKDITNQLENGRLVLFKFEDVGMGLWIEDFEKRSGTRVSLLDISDKVSLHGCNYNGIVSHYQTPDNMKCMHIREIGQMVNICCDKLAFNQFTIVETLHTGAANFHKESNLPFFTLRIIDGLSVGSYIKFSCNSNCMHDIELQMVTSSNVDVLYRINMYAPIQFKRPVWIINYQHSGQWHELESTVRTIRYDFINNGLVIRMYFENSDEPVIELQKSLDEKAIKYLKIRAPVDWNLEVHRGKQVQTIESFI